MIFTGTELLFFFLGMLTFAGILGIYLLKTRLGAHWQSLALAGTSLFLGIFTLAWSVTSILENEHQAANMGLLFFGLPALLLLAVAWKRHRATQTI